MTLILKVDLDMVKMYHYAKNQVSTSVHSKVIAHMDRHTQTHRQTDKKYKNIAFLHTQVVMHFPKTQMSMT